MVNRRQIQKAGERASESQNPTQVTSREDLLNYDHNDLSISPASLPTYRSNLRIYLDIQLRLCGVHDRISLAHFKSLGEISKERLSSLGYRPGMLSIVKRYADVMNAKSSTLYDLSNDKPFENRQHSSVLSAVNQRNKIKDSSSNPYAIHTKCLNQSLYNFIEDYRNAHNHLRERTIRDYIDKIRMFFGYKHHIDDKIGMGDIHNVLSDEIVDIITPKTVESYFSYMRTRNDGITSTAVQVVKKVFSLLNIDAPWTTLYINPLRSNDQKTINLAHRHGRKGLLSDIQVRYGETGQKIYNERYFKLVNTEGSFFSILTSEERDAYLHHAQVGYVNDIRPKIEKLIEKHEKESKQNGMTRNPFLPLMPLLELDDPMKPINLALQKSAAHIRELIKHSKSIETARVIRNHIFVSLISLWPLRHSHWLKMTYTLHQTGHISFAENGDLLFRIPIDDFKNSNSKEFDKQKIKGEFVELLLTYDESKELIDFIRIYINIYLPLFKHNSELIFYASSSSLTLGCKTWQKDYLHPICDQLKIARPLPFGSHGFRHIRVTSMLKAGETIDQAAIVLLDRPETVRNRYSAFLQTDGLQAIVQELATRRKNLEGK